MITPNMHYAELKDSYLFYNIAQKTGAYLKAHPGVHLYRMGIGDVSLPLCGAVIKALHEAVDDQADKARFHGYMPECGAPFLRGTIAEHYRGRGIKLADDEVFVSSGASDELGDILDLFDRSCSALVIEPAYPAYVDANVMAGRRIVHLPSGEDDGFLPEPDEKGGEPFFQIAERLFQDLPVHWLGKSRGKAEGVGPVAPGDGGKDQGGGVQPEPFFRHRVVILSRGVPAAELCVVPLMIPHQAGNCNRPERLMPEGD